MDDFWSAVSPFQAHCIPQQWSGPVESCATAHHRPAVTPSKCFSWADPSHVPLRQTAEARQFLDFARPSVSRVFCQSSLESRRPDAIAGSIIPAARPPPVQTGAPQPPDKTWPPGAHRNPRPAFFNFFCVHFSRLKHPEHRIFMVPLEKTASLLPDFIGIHALLALDAGGWGADDIRNRKASSAFSRERQHRLSRKSSERSSPFCPADSGKKKRLLNFFAS